MGIEFQIVDPVATTAVACTAAVSSMLYRRGIGGGHLQLLTVSGRCCTDGSTLEFLRRRHHHHGRFGVHSVYAAGAAPTVSDHHAVHEIGSIAVRIIAVVVMVSRHRHAAYDAIVSADAIATGGGDMVMTVVQVAQPAIDRAVHHG